MGFFTNLGNSLGGFADSGVSTVSETAQQGASVVADQAQTVGKGTLNVATLGEYGRSREMREKFEQLSEKLESIESPSAKAAESRTTIADGLDDNREGHRAIERSVMGPELPDTEVSTAIVEAQGESELAKHMVAEGDTLGTIAQDKGMDVSALIDLNPDLEDPNTIMPGQELNLGEISAEKSVTEQVAEATPESAPAGPEAEGPEV